MSNEQFKVKFGLAVGDTVATIDGTTGNIVTSGDASINGGDLVVGTAPTNATITMSADTTGIATTGITSTASDFTITHGGGTLVNVNSYILLSGVTPSGYNGIWRVNAASAGSLTVQSNANLGTATVQGTIYYGSSSLFGTTTNRVSLGTTSPVINIGSGSTFGQPSVINAYSNIFTSGTNYIAGQIRDYTTSINGDAWSMLSGAANPLRGLSIDNSFSATKRPGIALRGLSAQRGFIISEVNRGTTASPLAVNANTNLLEIAGSGYNGTQYVTDAITVAPISISLQSAEAFTSPAGVNTANGARLRVDAQPNGVTATAVSRSNIINHTPTVATYRSDSFAFSTREAAAGGTNTSLATLSTTASTVTSNSVKLIDPSQSLNFFQYVPLTADTTANTLSLSNVTTDGTKFGNFNFTAQRYNGSVYAPAQSGDNLGAFKFNGNYSSTGSAANAGPATQISSQATETWSNTATGAKLLVTAIKNGTTTPTTIIDHAPTAATYKADTFTLQSSASVGLVGNNITYNRVYGQWQWDATVTPAGNNTAYAFPIQGASGTTDFANIATVGSTSRIIPGAAGMYKLQFSLQIANSDNAAEHTAYIWWRRNGTDVPSSMGRVGIVKATGASDGLTIAGWDNMISSANTTDYWELMYAVDDSTHVSFPYFGTTAFGPATAAVFITLVPIGA